jgi:hypothetical protein
MDWDHRMNITRRDAIKSLAVGAAGSCLPAVPSFAAAGAQKPARFVFFLQNHGFMPAHAQPEDIPANLRLDRPESTPLAGHKLPSFIDPLEPIKDRVTILQGINGRHVRPIHGAPYGALGGFPKSYTTAGGETIDCALGKAFPGVSPALIFGLDSLDVMKASPIHYASSAWGANRPAPMFCDPVLTFNSLFGIIKPGTARDTFEADTELFELVKRDVDNLDARLPEAERARFASYREGFEAVGARRQRLLGMVDVLEKHAPKFTDQFTKPRFESDWWDASVEVAIAALKAGVTNVVTIASGRCESYGTWDGIGLKSRGHGFGHVNPPDEWLLLRRHNMNTLLRFVRALEAIPEGKGTMMDNSLIVYTSCHAEAQHSTGHLWPFLLIGNLGGRLKTGHFVHYPISPKPKSRTINALWCSLLHAAGVPRDHFNLDGSLKGIDKPGPLPEIMA